MHTTSRFVLPLLACTLLGGCAGGAARIAGDTAAAAGGALIGHKLGKGKPLSTAFGAGGGVLLGESLHAGSRASAEKSYVAGYEKGQSDSAKRQYQTLIERQRLAPQSDDAAHLRLFDVPLPEREQGGVNQKHHLAQADESPHDGDIDGNGTPTVQDSGMHGNAFLGEEVIGTAR